MLCYIKSRTDFKTKPAPPVVLDYDIALNSVYDDASSIVVQGEITGIEGDFIYVDGWLGVVSSVAPDRGQTTITATNILSAFSRPLLPTSGTYIEAFIKDTIEAQYKNLADTVYQMPYLSVTTTSNTGFISPDVEDGVWNIKSYAAKVRRLKSVFITWGMSGTNTLTCSIGVKATPTRRVDFADGANRLESETYSNYSVAKVTALVGGVATDYFLHSDGTFNTTNADRVSGAWEVIVTEAEKMADAVAEVFAKSAYSHLITFYSDRSMNFYDKLQIRTETGRVLNSYISCVRKSRNGVLYKSGELRTTFREQQKEMI